MLLRLSQGQEFEAKWSCLCNEGSKTSTKNEAIPFLIYHQVFFIFTNRAQKPFVKVRFPDVPFQKYILSETSQTLLRAKIYTRRLPRVTESSWCAVTVSHELNLHQSILKQQWTCTATLKRAIYSAKLLCAALNLGLLTLPHTSCCRSCGVRSVHAKNLSLYTMYMDTCHHQWHMEHVGVVGGTVHVLVIDTLPQPSHQTALTSLESGHSLWHWINSTVAQSCHPAGYRMNGVGEFAARRCHHWSHFKLESWTRSEAWPGRRKGHVEGNAEALHCLSFKWEQEELYWGHSHSTTWLACMHFINQVISIEYAFYCFYFTVNRLTQIEI